jgi:hypothetical protein
MSLQLSHNLIFTEITVAYQGLVLKVPKILVDTGSASTILAADEMALVNIFAAPTDILHTICGVGGTEVVFTKNLDYLQVGECRLDHFEIEVGKLDYGLGMKGILGLDFLLIAKTIINLPALKLEFNRPDG